MERTYETLRTSYVGAIKDWCNCGMPSNPRIADCACRIVIACEEENADHVLETLHLYEDIAEGIPDLFEDAIDFVVLGDWKI